MASVVQDRLVEVEVVEAPGVERVAVAEGKAFRAYDPDQVLLMAPCLQDWVPEGHLAHSCRRCGCAGGRGWLVWGRSRWMAPSCVRTRRVTRR